MNRQSGREVPLVEDAPRDEVVPRRYHTVAQPLPGDRTPPPSIVGLAELRASGSGQFSAAGIGTLMARATAVTVFDLRQEPHGFLDGLPVTWYGEMNWAGLGHSSSESQADERERLARVAAAGEALVATKEGLKTGAPPRKTSVVKAQTEEELVRAAGARYVRLAVPDHRRPGDEEVDRFVTAVLALPAGEWAHFHCRGGRGRTTTFLVLYDMLRNAGRVSRDDIVARQGLLAGDYDLWDIPPAEHVKHEIRRDRADFVRLFHEFALEHPGGEGETWSRWIARRRP